MTPPEGMTEFRAAWKELTDWQRQAVAARCHGATMQEVAHERGVTALAVRNVVMTAYERLRQGGMTGVPPHSMAETICWRLGYDQALDDIDTHMASKRAARAA